MIERFKGESQAHWDKRIQKQEEDEERADRALDMHDDVTEGPDVMRLANEAFFRGKSEGFNDGLRQGQLNSQDAVTFFQKELSDRMRRQAFMLPFGWCLTAILIGTAFTVGMMVALGVIVL